MSGRLNGKVALITGGTSGIGEATVKLFAAEGARVLIVGRNRDRGEAIASALGDAARFHEADVRTESAVAGALGAAKTVFGRLDILFNNAGGPTLGDIETFSEREFRESLDLLLGSVLFGIKHASPLMREQGWGAIINNSSVAALRTGYGGYLYSIAKAGVTHATKLAGIQLAPYGVTVNSISPGGVATPIFLGGSERAAGMEASHVQAAMAKLERNLSGATPTQRAGAPQDVAAAALFLASDEGHYVNCHDLVVDAGMSAGGRTRYDAADAS